MEKKKELSPEELQKKIATYPDTQILTLLKKQHEYGDVHTFIFRPTKSVLFTAGMFAHVFVDGILPTTAKPVRDLSIASAPSDGDVEFTTHIRKESPFKQKLGSLKEGDTITIFNIKGEFILPPQGTTPIVLIAGGIGITPYRSILRDVAQKHEERDITLVHISDGDFLYEEEFSTLPFPQHRISRNDLASYLSVITKEKPNALFYVSGPPPFVDSMKEKLMRLNISEQHIKQDWFDGYENSPTS